MEMPKSGPRILFLHVSQSGQFIHLSKWLAKQGWDVTVAHRGDGVEQTREGIRYVQYPMGPMKYEGHDVQYAVDYAAANLMGITSLLTNMRDVEGYQPDIVMAHVGWGVGLTVKQVWTETYYVAFHEWYYTEQDWENDGKLERPVNVLSAVSTRLRNLPISAEFDISDENWCPTHNQASRFPPHLRKMLTVIPDGVDCEFFSPDPEEPVEFDWLSLSKDTPILTYATRGMEPARGFPQFMKALERLQSERDDFHTIIFADDKVSYGSQLADGQSWRLKMFDELKLDHSRIHVQPMQPYESYRRLLRVSWAHVYFSENFVTSWSLADAMAAGCLLIGSNTRPVEEFVEDMETGILVDMDDREEVAEMISWAFDEKEKAAELGLAARELIKTRYSAEQVFAEKAAHLYKAINWSPKQH